MVRPYGSVPRCQTYIVEEVHDTAEAQDEKVKLLDQCSLAWHTLARTDVVLEASRERHYVDRRLREGDMFWSLKRIRRIDNQWSRYELLLAKRDP